MTKDESWLTWIKWVKVDLDIRSATCIYDISDAVLASQDALEVMGVSDWLTDSVQWLMISQLDWRDSGEWEILTHQSHISHGHKKLSSHKKLSGHKKVI